MGNHKNTPTDAFNYNKGKEVGKYLTGEKLQRQTPYDGCAVTDHSEYMGIFTSLADPKSPIADDPVVKDVQSGDKDKIDEGFKIIATSVAKNKPYAPFMNSEVRRSVWERQKKMIDDAYEPGKFTTLIAFEWTSMPNNQNLYRNVFFRDEGPELPFSSLDSNRPEDLWTYLDVQRNAGHDCLAIPHDGNISNGLMYAPFESDGDALTKLYAERRALNEPLTEIIQVKSASETHPALSPNDEFTDFELHYKGLIGTNPAVTSRIDYGFIRQALINGLGHEEKLGINPLEFGVVAGADSHTAFSINDEFNFTGPHGVSDATPKARLSGGAVSTGAPAIDLASVGTTAAWADENTREGIFDGLKRKETYGTLGTFIRLRFFGGWKNSDDLVKRKDFAKMAYADGVPMGGDLKPRPNNAKAPTFAVWATKDPKGATLDRIQIVKGWRHLGHGLEKVYDVAWSGDR